MHLCTRKNGCRLKGKLANISLKLRKKTICNLGTVGAMYELGDWVLLKAPPFRAPTRPELIKKMAQSIDKLDKKLELEFLPSI